MSLLYHGTSQYRLDQIITADHLRLAQSGVEKVSLTTSRAVAKYWARLSAWSDFHEECGTNQPVILVFRRRELELAGYRLEPYSDDVWDEIEGPGACDWEKEIACWNPISAALIDRIITDIEPSTKPAWWKKDQAA